MDALDIARFWSNVKVGRHTECWPWGKSIRREEYGDVKIAGVVEPAHRAAYLAAYGEIPEGAVVRHKCDNPRCCNPLHLETGTHADNVRDRVIRGRSAKGERNAKAKLTAEQVIEIRGLGFVPLRTLAARYGVTQQTIEAIRYGRSWRHLLNRS